MTGWDRLLSADIEMTVASLAHVLRWMLGPEWVPASVCFRRAFAGIVGAVRTLFFAAGWTSGRTLRFCIAAARSNQDLGILLHLGCGAK